MQDRGEGGPGGDASPPCKGSKRFQHSRHGERFQHVRHGGRAALLTALLATSTFATAQNLKHDTAVADLVLSGGRVVTLAEPGLTPRPLSIAVRGGRIAA